MAFIHLFIHSFNHSIRRTKIYLNRYKLEQKIHTL